MTQTTALHFFVSNSMRDHLLLYQSQWDKRQKKKRSEFPLKHLETSWKGNTAEKSLGRVEGQRHLHLLFFITHGIISFPLIIQGGKKKPTINRWTFSLSSGLPSPGYGCPTTGPEGRSDPESALNIMNCILGN